MRMIYELENGVLVDFYDEPSENFTYFMFVKDDKIVVNKTNHLYFGITKRALLHDIEVMNKYKDRKIEAFKGIKGMSDNFIKKLSEYDISITEIKEATERGKSENSRSNNIRKLSASINSRLTGFVVDYQR